MTKEQELEELEGEPGEQDVTETAAKRLEEAGDETGALRLRYQKLEGQYARLRAQQQQARLTQYTAELATEFDVPADLISGRTREQMRASAERAARAISGHVERKGLVPKAQAQQPPGGQPEKPGQRAEDWGVPPPMAKETVSGESPREWADLERGALSGALGMEAVVADIRENSPRRIVRPTIVGAALRGRGEAPRTPPEAKP